MWSILFFKNFWLFTRFVAFCIIFTELIGEEGARSSKMHSHFLLRCLLKGANSMSSGSSGTGETPQTRSAEEAHRPAVR
ncbi:hypothetical protein VL14_14140 [Cytobacillus firmus]|nr:hypothetical protein VL14_14140 [Cytobacillus firmus]